MVAGRLASFADTWKVLTEDLWVLNTIEGYQIPFKEVPVQALGQVLKRTRGPVESRDRVPSSEGCHLHNPEGFYSSLFLVPKKNGQMRPVINLKQLNQWVETSHFKMEGISILWDLLRMGHWMVKVELKDAYLCIQHNSRQQVQTGRGQIRLEGDRSDWMLSHTVLLKINQLMGPLEVDTFASRLTHQLPRFFSWRLDPLAEAVDAFQQDWSKVRG